MESYSRTVSNLATELSLLLETPVATENFNQAFLSGLPNFHQFDQQYNGDWGVNNSAEAPSNNSAEVFAAFAPFLNSTHSGHQTGSPSTRNRDITENNPIISPPVEMGNRQPNLPPIVNPPEMGAQHCPSPLINPILQNPNHAPEETRREKILKKKNYKEDIAILSAINCHYGKRAPLEYDELINFIIDSSYIRGNPTQIRKKLREMKNKYAVLREERGHDQLMDDDDTREPYQLWRAIYDRDGATGPEIESLDAYPYLKQAIECKTWSESSTPLSQSMVDAAVKKLQHLDMKELDEEWRKVKMAETEAAAIRTSVIQKQNDLLLRIFRSV